MAKIENKIEEFLDQPEAIIEDLQSGKLEQFYEQHKNIITFVGGGIALLIAAIVFGKYYLTTQNEEAQNTMFQAVYYFESDSLNKALNGDGANPGFVEITESYPFTKAANIASYYAGVCYLKMGKWDDAIDFLEDFGSNDILVQARAYSLLGDAYMEKGELEDAIAYYKKASNWKPTKEYTPDYLMKLGLAYELNKEYKNASETYNKIITDFPNSNRVNDAKKFKGLNDALAATD